LLLSQWILRAYDAGRNLMVTSAVRCIEVEDHPVGEHGALVDGRTRAGNDDCIAEFSMRLL